MSQPAVKWGRLLRFLNRHNFQINTDGGDKLIIKDGKVHRIGHKFCTSNNDELSPAHLSAIKRKFGVTREDILND